MAHLPGSAQVIRGTVSDSSGVLPNVLIQLVNDSGGTTTNNEGQYRITAQPGAVELRFILLGYQTVTRQVFLSKDEVRTLNVLLREAVTTLEEVEIQDDNREELLKTPGLITIDPKTATLSPAPFNEFNRVLKTLPGVVSNNELSSAYSVRGGNFDENLVYVNNIQVYRPFLIRAGQQEGLSFINPDLVRSVQFSSGGWQPRYGDKLSSSLNVTYKKPGRTAGSVNLNLLGGAAHVETTAFGQQLGILLGARQKRSEYLLNTLDVDGQYLPRFTDVQGLFTVNPDQWNNSSLEVLLAYAANDYQVRPESQSTTFGTFNQPFRFQVSFQGQEQLQYKTLQTALKWKQTLADNWQNNTIVSYVNTREQERFDIISAYELCQVGRRPGQDDPNACAFIRGVGASLEHGRNSLSAQLLTVENRNVLVLNEENTLYFGLSYTLQDVNDRLEEYLLSDSADFSRFEESISSTLSFTTNRLEGYMQHGWETSNHKLNYGVRLNYWDFNNEWLISPRLQYTFTPNWDRAVTLKVASGLYQQSPFYRELRNRSGEINTGVDAQSSFHQLVGISYPFQLFGRSFSLNTEAYYKYLYNVNPYDVENVRIRYFAENSATAYAVGADIRVAGELIKGAESWISLGILSTRENVEGDGKGYIRRPTDQRVTVSALVQDHLPNDPTVRGYLSLTYGSGLPFSAPDNDEFRNAFVTPVYNRVDLGFSKQVFFDAETTFLESLWLGIEVLNAFGARNVIAYTWITDVTDTQFAVPNNLSQRFINGKVIARF